MIHYVATLDNYRRYANGIVVTSPRFICRSYDKNKEIGDFTIESFINYGSVEDTFMLTDIASMSIYVLEDYQNQGIARKMISTLVEFIRENYRVRSDKLLFIDADASNGFWDHIGMRPNRYYESNYTRREGYGYEKVITWSELVSWSCPLPVLNYYWDIEFSILHDEKYGEYIGVLKMSD